MTMIACPECDALQEEPRRVPRGTIVHCWRCGSTLRRHPRPVGHVLALCVTAAVLFMMANAFPIVSLEAGGNAASTTLSGDVVHLWTSDLQLVALLVGLTTIVAPAFDIASMLYLLVGVVRLDVGRAASMPPGSAALMRLTQKTRPWSMLEVFMLGALVSIVKLGSLASVIAGISLYSLGALILVLAAANAAFDPRMIWSRLPVRPTQPMRPGRDDAAADA